MKLLALFRLVPGHTWILLGAIAALLTWHFGEIEATKLRTRAEVNTEWQAKIEAANAQAKADHDAQQAQIDQLAKSSQPEIAKKFDSLKQQIASLETQAKQPPKVFASNCVLQVDQVEAFNAIR